MFDSARTAAEVPLQTRTHYSPAKAWTVTHSIICVANTKDTLLNQRHDLFVEGGLESITNVTGKFLVQLNWLLSDRGVKRNCALNRLWRRPGSTYDFDQGNDVRRVERVTNQDPL